MERRLAISIQEGQKKIDKINVPINKIEAKEKKELKMTVYTIIVPKELYDWLLGKGK